VVAHNGAEYLPETLSALAAQTRPADFCIGVDAGSADASASQLQLGLPVGSPVIGAPARSGFGAAVKAGLEQMPRRAEAPDPTIRRLIPERWRSCCVPLNWRLL